MRKKTKFSDTLDFKCDNEWPKGEPKENWDWEAGTPLSWVLATTSRGGFLFATSFRVEHSRAYREGSLKAL